MAIGFWLRTCSPRESGCPSRRFPVLLGHGRARGTGQFLHLDLPGPGRCAALTSDLIWFRLGRVRGHSILNLLCRMSLEPDSCVSNTKSLFGRLGARALMIAKFVPGLGATAAPLAGLTRMNPWKFLAADAAGAVPGAEAISRPVTSSAISWSSRPSRPDAWAPCCCW